MTAQPNRMWLDDQDFTTSRAIQEIYALARERNDPHFETVEAITGHLQMTDEVLETPIAMSFSILSWALSADNRWLQLPTLLGITSHLRRVHAHDTYPVLVRRHQTQALIDYERDSDDVFRSIIQDL